MLKPLFDRMVVEILDEKEEKVGQILLPNSKSGYVPARAKVLNIGPGREGPNGLVPTTVSVGDVVMYDRNIRESFKLNGKNILVLREEEIFGIEMKE